MSAPHRDKLIVLKLQGDLEHEELRVTAELGFEGERPAWDYSGHLPPAPQLFALLNQWRDAYRRLGGLSRFTMRLTPHEIDYSGSINNPFDYCRQSAQALEEEFCRWILQAEGFQDINLRLREFCNLDDAIHVIVRAADISMYRLPWHRWDFIRRYERAEVAVSGLTAERVDRVPLTSPHPAVKILAILGDPTGIDVQADTELLDSLPHAKVTFLVQPDRSVINDQLWDQDWDILFFAGHSTTKTQGDRTTGQLFINQSESLSLEELAFGLRQSIRRGLRLAIFNSCDGLGLAQTLEQLHLPQFIVMREPVPDKVAQTFLNRFLQAFAAGEPLYQAVRRAREQLQGVEHDYPCASWLPIIYQDLSARSPCWQEFYHVPPSPESETEAVSIPELALPAASASVIPSPSPLVSDDPTSREKPSSESSSDGRSEKKPLPSLRLLCLMNCGMSVVVTGLLIGARLLGWMQPLELKAYDHLMSLRPHQNTTDSRILVVGIDDEDIQYQHRQGMELAGSLSDTALLNLLRRIESYRPAAVGLDIIRDFEFEPELAAYMNNQPHIFAICRDQTPIQPGVSPPPSMPIEQLGFTTTPLDPDGIVRRQFLGAPKTQSRCQTEKSLGFQLALRYLETIKGMTMEWIPTPHASSFEPYRLSLGGMVIPRVTVRAGGYRLPAGEAGGYQVLINYRSGVLTQVNLRHILSGSVDSQLSDLVRDRIILIGIADQKTDLHMTPYHQGTPRDAIAGVMIQAQTASSIMSAVLGERPLMRWWSEGYEILWIAAWGLLAGVVMPLWPSSLPRWIAAGTGLIVLYIGCLLLLLLGVWAPMIPAGATFLITTTGYFKVIQIRNRE